MEAKDTPSFQPRTTPRGTQSKVGPTGPKIDLIMNKPDKKQKPK